MLTKSILVATIFSLCAKVICGLAPSPIGDRLDTAESGSASMQYCLSSSDDVIFLACDNTEKNLNHPILRVIPKATRLWTSLTSDFHKALTENTHNNVRTAVILLSLLGKETLGALRIRKNHFWTYLADWIVLPAGEPMSKSRNAPVSAAGFRIWSNGTSALHQTGEKLCLSFVGAATLSRKYGFPDDGHDNTFAEALAGQRIMTACILQQRRRERPYNSCEMWESKGIGEDLQALNATLAFSVYGGWLNAIHALFRGIADVHMELAKASEQISALLHLSHPLRFTYETFYVCKEDRRIEVTFFAVPKHSWVPCLTLIFAMVSVWLTLTLSGYLDRRALRLHSLMDTAQFLVASFLSSSAPMQNRGRGDRAYPGKLARMIALSAWSLGILPFSAYIRSELTSRLAVAVPPNPIDTLEELEMALDKDELHVCVNARGCVRARLNGSMARSSNTLYAKLRDAFEREQGGTAVTSEYHGDCLKCASRPGSVCVMCGLEYCAARTAARQFVESRETLNIAFALTPVRKGYSLAKAYDQLLQRLFETAMRPYNYKWMRCDVESGASLQNVRKESAGQISQMLELSPLFATFVCLTGVSTVIFGFELTLGLRRKFFAHG